MKIVWTLALGIVAAVPSSPARTASAPAERTVYVTVLDDKREPVPDLTAADFVVKEGGKEREIVKVERATTPLRLALAVEERMTADASVRTALFEFMKRLSGAGEISLITIGLRNTTIVDYTTSLEALVGGINKFTLNPARESVVGEGVLELANRFIDARPQRPVIVLVALSGGQAGASPRLVLDRLGQSGATMHAVTLAFSNTGASTGEEVLGEAVKQSGGRRIEVTATGAMPKSLLQIANEILAQYAITYSLPDGVKPDRRFNATLKRRGVSLRTPSTIPDK
jgi:hypothetical protein